MFSEKMSRNSSHFLDFFFLECATQACNASDGVGEKRKKNTTVHAEPEV